MFDVFLSYKSQDHEIVEKAARLLRADNLCPFLDRWHLVHGQRWRPMLEAILVECRAVAVFVGPSGMGRWQQREVDAALDRQAGKESFPVIPVLLPGSEPPLGFLKQITWIDLRNQPIEQGAVLLSKAIRGEPPGPDAQAQFAKTRSQICPYRGLLAFREEDAGFFFGREKAVAEIQRSVAAHGFVSVVGASGSGKSSVVRAGLVPQLRKDRETTWDIVTLVPGEHPLRALAGALMPLLEPEKSETDRLIEVGKLADALSAGTIRLEDVIRLVLRKQPGTDRLLLVADQWEEVYTLANDDNLARGQVQPHPGRAEADPKPSGEALVRNEKADRIRFIDELLDASKKSPLTVVATLRGDFVGKALAYRPLSDRLQGAQVNLGPMTRHELALAVVEPAKRVGLEFEEGLEERILDAVGDEPGNLPLLEFVLKGLWEKCDRGLLTHEAYETLGGLQGAIAAKADEVFNRLSDPEKAALQRMFLLVVRVDASGNDTRRREHLASIPEASRKLVGMLADARLLVTSRSSTAGGETVEVAHEALIGGWKRLKGWLDSDREFLLWRERLRGLLPVWNPGGQHEGPLLSVAALAEAEKWLSGRSENLTPEERSFIETNREEHRRKRQLEDEARQRAHEQQLRWEQAEAARARDAESHAREAAAAAYLLAAEANRGRSLFRTWATVAACLAFGIFILAVFLHRERQTAEEKTSVAITAGSNAVVQANLANERLLGAEWLAAQQARGTPFLSVGASPIAATHHLLRAASVADSGGDSSGVYSALLGARSTASSVIYTIVHDGAVVDASYSPAGDILLTRSDDGTARLWDAVTGASIGQPLKHERPVKGALFGADSKQVLSWSDDGTIRLWDAATGASIGQPLKHERHVNGALFSADSKRVLSWSDDGTARLWDAATGASIGQPLKHERPVKGALFSADSKRVLSWSDDTTRLWDADNGGSIGPKMEHKGRGGRALLSADSKRVLSWGGIWSDDSTRLWDADNGGSIVQKMEHEGPVDDASFSADGKRVLSWSVGGTARLWDAATGAGIGQPMKHGLGVHGALFSADGKRVLSWSFSTTRLWDASNGAAIGHPMEHKEFVFAALFSADSKQVLSWSKDHTARLWDAADGTIIGQPMKHGYFIHGARFSADGTLVLSWSEDHTARLWDTADGTVIGPTMKHERSVTGALFSADGKHVLSWSKDHTARLWDAADGSVIGPTMKHERPIIRALFSADGKRVLSRSDDTARLWDAATGAGIGQPMKHERHVNGALLSADGERVLSWSDDGTARLWDAATGGSIGQPMKHEGPVREALFSTDEKQVLSRSDDTARLWDAATGVGIGQPMKHERGVVGALFSADGKRVLSRSDDTARLWDAATGAGIGCGRQDEIRVILAV